jgi:nucleoporin NUP82
VYFVSLESWIRKLEEELAEPQSEGIEFRLNRLLESSDSLVELCMPTATGKVLTEEASTEEVNSCVVIADGNIGYFLLTVVAGEPKAVILDAPEDGLPTEDELAASMHLALPSIQTRPIYQPPKELYEPLQFVTEVKQLVPARHKASSNEEIRLSPANLDILMKAHKLLSQDTHKLQTAASNLFVQCERLRNEFRDQVYRASQLVPKIDAVTGNDEEQGDSDAYGAARIEERLDRVQTKQQELSARYEAIRRKMMNVGGSDLSEKESALLEELSTMDRSLDKGAQTLTDDPDGSDDPAWQRLEKVKELQKELTKQVQSASRQGAEERKQSGVKVPSHSRKQETEQIEALLQRETALVEAATNRLRSMGIAIPLDNGS